eukprot:gene19737-47002_t
MRNPLWRVRLSPMVAGGGYALCAVYAVHNWESRRPFVAPPSSPSTAIKMETRPPSTSALVRLKGARGSPASYPYSWNQRALSVRLFGNGLLTKGGMAPTADVLADKKHVVAYFCSAKCAPCRSPRMGAPAAAACRNPGRPQGARAASPHAPATCRTRDNERDRKKELASLCNVEGIPATATASAPALVALRPDGEFVKGPWAQGLYVMCEACVPDDAECGPEQPTP